MLGSEPTAFISAGATAGTRAASGASSSSGESRITVRSSHGGRPGRGGGGEPAPPSSGGEIVFKGPGFYATDYRKPAPGEKKGEGAKGD